MQIRTLALALALPASTVLAQPQVLMVVTNEATMGQGGEATGLWLEELAVPYAYLQQQGAKITLASVAGGNAPVDPRSLDTKQPKLLSFLKQHQQQLNHTATISSLAGQAYDAVVLVGGHGTMWDFRQSDELAALLSQQWQQGASLAAVCHGVAGLLEVEVNGSKLVEGKRLTGFSNSEEAILELTDVVPYALETALVEAGADYSQGANYTPYVVEDGRLITGQNPMSSEAMAHLLWQQLDDDKRDH